MHPHPAADPSHPDHLDYFTGIVSRNLALRPVLGSGAYVAPGAFLAGAVTLGDRASIWPSASLRGDIAPITVGEESNVQDNAVIHVGTEHPAELGKRVTVGHGAVVHGCTVGDGSLVGMGAVILDGAIIGEHCLIGARSTVLGGTVIPSGSMVLGSPARIHRQLTPAEQAGLESWAEHYLILAREYRRLGIVHPAHTE